MRKLLKRDEGFTLIELMVVVLIIGILVAIALPTFLGARERAQNKAAQSSLRNSLVAAKTAFTDNDDYTGADTVAELEAIEPSLTYLLSGVDAASTGPNLVNFVADDVVAANNDNAEWAAAAMSDSGTCYWIHSIDTGAGSGTFFGSTATAANCTGTQALAAAATAFP